MKKIIIAIITIISLLVSSFQTVYADTSDPGIKVYSPYTYVGKGALDAKQSFDTKADMASFDEKYLDDGMRTYCKENDTWYEYNSSNTSNATTGKWKRLTVGQYTEMPGPNSERLGDVYQYIGNEDTAEFKRGYFYEVIENNGTYDYKQKNVQDQVKIDPIILDSKFKNDPYNYNKLNIDSASIKIYNGMIYANVVAKYKVKKTDISTAKEIVMKLPEIPATASTAYPYSCQVTITTPKDEYITCEENRHEFYDTSGSHYVNPNVAVGEPFFINNFTKITNAYSDVAHTTPINICEANVTSSGVVLTSDGINPDVKKHGVHFNIGQNIPETLYRCVGQPIKYTEINGYYDNNGVHHDGTFYELTQVSDLTPNINYLYQCKLINEMRKYCGEEYMVDSDGKICRYLITESARSEQMGCLYDMPEDIGYGFGIDGSIQKTYEKDRGFSYTMNAEIDPVTREVKIPAIYPIEKVVMTISGQ